MRLGGGFERTEQLLDFGVARIRFEQPLVPRARRVEIARLPGDVAEVAQRDEVFGV
jgi:hypothetical protein